MPHLCRWDLRPGDDLGTFVHPARVFLWAPCNPSMGPYLLERALSYGPCFQGGL